MVQKYQYIPTFDYTIFENRNKEYGAYKIRKEYDHVVLISLLIAVFVVSTAIIVPYIRANRDTTHSTIADRREIPFNPDKDLRKMDPPPPVLQPPPAKLQTVPRYVPPVVVDDKNIGEIPNLMPTEELGSKIENKPVDIEVVVPRPIEDLGGNAVEPPPVFFAQEMPEFPGGDLALRQFIAKAIIYPSIAIESRIQGKVYVNFIVNKDGTVSNVIIARSVDPSIDNEALRVVSTLPKWKPGKQNGNPVRVYYTVPITFRLDL